MRSQMRHSIPLREPFRTVLIPRFSWSSYWKNNTSFWGRGRDGLTIPDDYGNDAKIMPVAFQNGATYYRNNGGNLFSSDDWVFNIEIYLNEYTGSTILTYQAGFYFKIDQTNSVWKVVLSDGANNRSFNVAFATLPLTSRKYVFMQMVIIILELVPVILIQQIKFLC